MKQLNNSTAGAVSKIHALAFTLFFIVEQVLSEYAYPFFESKLEKPLYILISAIISAVLYTFLAWIITTIYNFVITSKNKKLKIDGVWYHVHIPHLMGEEDYTQKRVSAGTTKVSRNLLDFTFVGNNERCYLGDDGKLLFKNENATHWYTKATKLSDENDFDIIEIYEAKTKGNPTRLVDSCPCCQTKFKTPIEVTEAEKYRYGIHKIDIVQENGKTYMRSDYSDCWPSLKTGELLFFRTQEERDERILEFFENAKNKQKKIIEETENQIA
ncbi:MAG: hypothetical protein IJW58_01505 [Clostridia bacterium]|nr:hypothetical protein [Clostridia bacterium]